MGGTKQPYTPPSEFQEAETETLVKEALSDTTELWLFQMPLNQLEPADFMGKQLSLKLNGDVWLGCLRNSHGKPFDLVNVGNQEAELFAFIPGPSASRGVRRIARHIRLQGYGEDYLVASGKAKSTVGFSGSKDRDSVNRGTQSLVQEHISHDHKSSQVISATLHERGEPSTRIGKRSRKEGQLNGTPIASYGKNLEESGAYDASKPQGQSFVTAEVKEERSTGGKKKSRKHRSEV